MAASSVALGPLADGTVACRQTPMVRGHAEMLIPLVQEVVVEAGCVFSDIDAIVTSVGPGAFTGLRIGLSAAQALGLSLEKPVYGLTTLDILSAQFFADQALIAGDGLAVILETKRSDFYFGLYDAQGGAVAPGRALTAEEILSETSGQALTIVGDGADRFLKSVPDDVQNFHFVPGYDLPDPRVMVSLAVSRNQPLLPPDPVYLRGADVSKSKRVIRRICD